MIFNADVSGAIGSSVQSGNSELLARFPGESPEERIATEWIKDTYSRLIAAGFGAILRRTTPPHLIALEDSTATSVPAWSKQLTWESHSTGAPSTLLHPRYGRELPNIGWSWRWRLVSVVRAWAPVRAAFLQRHFISDKWASSGPVTLLFG